MKHTPVRRFRPTLRRGEPNAQEKLVIRKAVYARAGGLCELRLAPNCARDAVLPFEGEVFQRAHLCHMKAKRRFGWRESEYQVLKLGCPACHLFQHSGGKPCPKKERV